MVTTRAAILSADVRLFIAGEDQTVKVWDLASGMLLRDLVGHTDFIYSLVFSNDSALLASGQLKHYTSTQSL